MQRIALSREQIAKELAYDSDTGDFTWIRPRIGVKVGHKAGCTMSRGYVQIMLGYEKYQAHRLAWFVVYGDWPKGQIDHIDGDKANNRIDNLRDVGGSENSHNCLRPVGKSGRRGVKWNSRKNRWEAGIKINGKRVFLGMYSDVNAAGDAYVAAKKKLVPESRIYDLELA